jgi:hypothetical protein
VVVVVVVVGACLPIDIRIPFYFTSQWKRLYFISVDLLVAVCAFCASPENKPLYKLKRSWGQPSTFLSSWCLPPQEENFIFVFYFFYAFLLASRAKHSISNILA